MLNTDLNDGPDTVPLLIANGLFGSARNWGVLANRLTAVDLENIDSRADAKAQLGDLEPGVPDFLLQSLDMRERRWRLNLDVLEAEMDKIIGFPAIAGQFAGPTLFLSGAASDYVQPDARPLIKDLFPHAKFAKIPGAGHWLHAEKPREFEAAVSTFLHQT